MELGKPLDFPSDEFDAVVATGVFVAGHAPAGSFDELVRITRPGGHIMFSIRPDLLVSGGFKEKGEQLESALKWRSVETLVPFRSTPLSAAEAQAVNLVFAYTVL